MSVTGLIDATRLQNDMEKASWDIPHLMLDF